MNDVLLVETDFDPAAALAAFQLTTQDEGAIVSFTGLARGKSKDGQALLALELESHPTMTLASMQALADDAKDRWPISRLLIIHRAGIILPGEAIVFVATASAHRRAAFESADYLMDRLKTEAIFWKKEIGDGFSQWIEPTNKDEADRERWEII